MKILICSDIHGHDEEFAKVVNFFNQEQLDKMIILGDIFTTLNPGDVSSHEIGKLLWSIPSKLIMLKGNCDIIIDQDLCPVGMIETYEDVVGKYRCKFYHGHHYVSTTGCKIACSGHTHIFGIHENDGIIYVNPGSVGRPRDYSKGSFGVLTPYSITIYDLDYNVLDEFILK